MHVMSKGGKIWNSRSRHECHRYEGWSSGCRVPSLGGVVSYWWKMAVGTHQVLASLHTLIVPVGPLVGPECTSEVPLLRRKTVISMRRNFLVVVPQLDSGEDLVRR